ncbi:MAG: oligosaccharide flippase family protein [Thermodesulfobacteriota bacterium]
MLATVWVVGGYGLAQVLRLGGNLILTRLLVPEFFGIMAIAHVFMVGLTLFSDIGLGPGVIRSSRSGDRAFLNSAWTLQIIRGLVLYLFSAAIAFPVAQFYEMPILAKVMPVLGLVLLIEGFLSTSIFSLNKEVKLGRITTMEVGAQFLGLLVMVVTAYLYRSVWALVAGGLVVALVKAVWSHFLNSERNRIGLEREAVKELFSFGKWVFVATAMMFLATQADRFLLGKLFPLSLFGIYNIAVIFAELPKQVLTKLSNRVIFPLMAQFSELPREEFRNGILAKRLQLLLPLALLVAVFAGFGDLIINQLYDERYHQAGWMLPLLALGMWPFILSASIDRCLYAIGLPQYSAVGNFCKFLYMVIAVPISFKMAGPVGGVVAVALNDLPVYLVVNYGLSRERLTCLRQDGLVTLLLAVLLVLILALRFALDLGLPGRGLLLG